MRWLQCHCRDGPANGIVRTVRANLHKDSVQRRWVPMVDTSGSMEDERYDGQPMEKRPLAGALKNPRCLRASHANLNSHKPNGAHR